MSVKENKAKLRRYYELGWNEGQLDLVDETFADDYINHNPGFPGQPPGPQGVKVLINAFR